MARAPVKDIPLSAQLRPVATPVDTFVRPAQSPLRDLAASLSTFDRSIQQFLSVRDEKAMRDDEIRGRAAFYQDSAGEFAKAVTSGQIPAHYSPSYVQGFKNAQGSAAGEALRTKWQDAWDNWEGKDSEDPEAFNTFFSSFIKENVGTDDPEVLAGVLPSVEALQANATTQYTQYRHDKTVQGNLTAHGAIISSTVQSGVDDGLVSDTGADYGAIFQNVDQVVADSLAKGDPGGKAVDTFIDVMSAKILETKDPRLLDWFSRKVPGKDFTYGDTPHGLEVKNATIASLEVYAGKQQNELDERQRAEQKRLRDEAEAKLIDGLIANPNAPMDEKLLNQAQQNGNPTIRVQAIGWRDALTKAQPSDPREVQAFYSRIVGGEMAPKAALKHALANGVFSSPEDLRTAVSFVQSFETSEDTITTTLNGQVARQVQEVIRQRTVARNDMTGDPLTGTSDEGLEATADFRRLITDWIISNPNATLPQIEEQVTKFGKMITDRFQAGGFGEASTYERDPNLPFENPYSTPAAQTDPANTTPSATDPNADVRAWEQTNALTPDQRAILTEQATQSGMSYEEFIRDRVLSRQPQPQATPTQPQPQGSTGEAEGLQPSPISYTPDDTDLGQGDASGMELTPQRAEELINQAFEIPAMVNPNAEGQEASLLAFLRQHEATGNYNAVYGNPGNQVDLSQFTVDGILAQQQEARRRGIKSTAVGGYQFLMKTLKGLKAEMGLTGNEPFTPELQDRMAMTLLNRRGLQAYRAGRISKKQFALSLSQEWAAIPSPETGRSFYAGDGLNRSRVPVQAVYQALGFPDQPQATPAVLPAGQGYQSDPVKLASYFVGMNEQENRDAISRFIKQAGGEDLDPAETAWCAAFINGVLGATGRKGTGSNLARSFLDGGQPVDPAAAREGDIIVFKRGRAAWQGHVGFYLGEEVRDGELYYKVLSGNAGKSGEVNEAWYPAKKLLGIRRYEPEDVMTNI